MAVRTTAAAVAGICEVDSNVDLTSLKLVPKWEKYAASSQDGSIWSYCSGEWVKLKQQPTRDGYRHIVLYDNNGIPKRKTVHSVILETFVGPKPKGKQCRHKNGVRHDNRLTNIRWGTPKKNAADREKHGNTMRGNTHIGSKLTEQKVKKIRRLYEKRKTPLEALGKRFHVSRDAIWKVVKRITWRHI